MLVEFQQELVDMQGDVILEDDETPATLGSASIRALHGTLRGDDNLDGKKKYELGKLARAIDEAMCASRPAKVSAEDVATLKARIGLGYGPLVVVQCWDMLEGNEADGQGD